MLQKYIERLHTKRLWIENEKYCKLDDTQNWMKLETMDETKKWINQKLMKLDESVSHGKSS